MAAGELLPNPWIGDPLPEGMPVSPATTAPGYSYNPSTGRIEWAGNIRTATNPATLSSLLPCAKPLSSVGFSYPRTYYTGSYLTAEGINCAFPGEKRLPLDIVFPPRNFKPATVPEIMVPGFIILPGAQPDLAPQPVPYRKPGLQVNPSRWQRPRPVNSVDVRPMTRPRPLVRPGRTPPVKPGRGVKEIKVRSRGVARVLGFLNQVGEAADFIDVLYEASGGPPYADLKQQIWWLFVLGNVSRLDMEAFWNGMVNEWIGDRIGGVTGEGSRELARDLGWLFGPETGPALGGGWVNSPFFR